MQRVYPAADPPQFPVLLFRPHPGDVGRNPAPLGEAVEHGLGVGKLARRGHDGACDELGRVLLLREEVAHQRSRVDNRPFLGELREWAKSRCC